MGRGRAELVGRQPRLLHHRGHEHRRPGQARRAGPLDGAGHGPGGHRPRPELGVGGVQGGPRAGLQHPGSASRRHAHLVGEGQDPVEAGIGPELIDRVPGQAAGQGPVIGLVDHRLGLRLLDPAIAEPPPLVGGHPGDVGGHGGGGLGRGGEAGVLQGGAVEGEAGGGHRRGRKLPQARHGGGQHHQAGVHRGPPAGQPGRNTTAQGGA